MSVDKKIEVWILESKSRAVITDLAVGFASLGLTSIFGDKTYNCTFREIKTGERKTILVDGSVTILKLGKNFSSERFRELEGEYEQERKIMREKKESAKQKIESEEKDAMEKREKQAREKSRAAEKQIKSISPNNPSNVLGASFLSSGSGGGSGCLGIGIFLVVVVIVVVGFIIYKFVQLAVLLAIAMIFLIPGILWIVYLLDGSKKWALYLGIFTGLYWIYDFAEKGFFSNDLYEFNFVDKTTIIIFWYIFVVVNLTLLLARRTWIHRESKRGKAWRFGAWVIRVGITSMVSVGLYIFFLIQYDGINYGKYPRSPGVNLKYHNNVMQKDIDNSSIYKFVKKKIRRQAEQYRYQDMEQYLAKKITKEQKNNSRYLAELLAQKAAVIMINNGYQSGSLVGIIGKEADGKLSDLSQECRFQEMRKVFEAFDYEEKLEWRSNLEVGRQKKYAVQSHGRTLDAIILLRKAIKVFPKNSMKYARHLASAYCMIGEYDEAGVLYQKLLGYNKGYNQRRNTKKELIVVQNYIDIGINLALQEKYKDAIEYYTKAKDSIIEEKGKNHYAVAVVNGHISLAFALKGDTKNAIVYHDEAVGIWYKTFPVSIEETRNNSHNISYSGEPYSIFSYNDLDIVFGTNRQHEKLLGVSISGLDDTENNDSIGSASIYSSVAFNWAIKNNYKQATKYYKDALEIYSTILGEEHFRTANAYLNLGNACYIKKEYCDADSITRVYYKKEYCALENYNKALGIQEKVLKKNDIAIARTLHHLANAQFILSEEFNTEPKVEESIKNHEKALRIRISNNATEEIAESYNDLALVKIMQGYGVGGVAGAREKAESDAEKYLLKILKNKKNGSFYKAEACSNLARLADKGNDTRNGKTNRENYYSSQKLFHEEFPGGHPYIDVVHSYFVVSY